REGCALARRSVFLGRRVPTRGLQREERMELIAQPRAEVVTVLRRLAVETRAAVEHRAARERSDLEVPAHRVGPCRPCEERSRDHQTQERTTYAHNASLTGRLPGRCLQTRCRERANGAGCDFESGYVTGDPERPQARLEGALDVEESLVVDEPDLVRLGIEL